MQVVLYIRSYKARETQEFFSPVMPEAICQSPMTVKTRIVYRKQWTQADQQARKLLDALQVPYSLVDLSTPWGRLRAWLRGVKQTPTIIVKQSYLMGEDITEVNIRQLLESDSGRTALRS